MPERISVTGSHRPVEKPTNREFAGKRHTARDWKAQHRAIDAGYGRNHQGVAIVRDLGDAENLRDRNDALMREERAKEIVKFLGEDKN